MEAFLDYGYIGLFIGALLAATVIPFSSDVLLIGMLLAGGNIVATVIVATVGNWLGGLISYYMGYCGKWEWLEKWFNIKRETLEKQKDKVDKYGVWLALGSWLPIVGDLFSVGLGFYRVNPVVCAIYMFIGKMVRFIGWALLYYYTKDSY